MQRLSNVFRKTWVPAHTLVDLVPGAGARRARVGDSELIVTGDRRAFYNRCPHRGARLLHDDDGGSRKTITCKYHGMGFRLADGSLVKAPQWPDAPAHDLCLTPLHTAAYGPFLMVNDDPGDPGPFPHADPVPPAQREREAAFTCRAQGTFEVAAPFHMAMENFLDYYHVKKLHPALAKHSKPASHEHLHAGPAGWHFSTDLDLRHDSPLSRAMTRLGTRVAGSTAWFSGVWPSAFAFRMPTHVFAVVLEHHVRAGDPYTRENAKLFAPREWSDEQVAEVWSYYEDINAEDVEAIGWLVDGRCGGGARRGPVFHPTLEQYSRAYTERLSSAMADRGDEGGAVKP